MRWGPQGVLGAQSVPRREPRCARAKAQSTGALIVRTFDPLFGVGGRENLTQIVRKKKEEKRKEKRRMAILLQNLCLSSSNQIEVVG